MGRKTVITPPGVPAHGTEPTSAAGSFLTPTPALKQGIARVLGGDLDGGDECLEDAVSVGEQVGSPEDVAVALCERSLVAMARSHWDRAQLTRDRGSGVPGASALTTAELRLLPLLSTHLSFPQIAGEMFLSPYTIKSQAMSIYRKLGASSRSQAVARSLELGLLEGWLSGLSSHQGDGPRPGTGWTGALQRAEVHGPGPAHSRNNPASEQKGPESRFQPSRQHKGSA